MTDTANAPEQLVVIWTIADEDTMPATVSAHTPKSRDFEHGAPRWMEGKRLEYVLATHCDELVAAERAKLAAIVAAQESVIKAWPRVRLILQEYDNAFPYAELEGDDEAVCALERAIRALAPDNSRAAL